MRVRPGRRAITGRRAACGIGLGLGIATVLLLLGAQAHNPSGNSGWTPDAGAALAAGSGWRSWWGGHGRDVAAVAGCFLDGVAAARWLALGGSALAAAGLVAAGLACFS